MEAVSPCAAGFTNLTQDHLGLSRHDGGPISDAKLRLFTELLPQDGVAVVNIDDTYGARVAEIVEARGNRGGGASRNTPRRRELKIIGRRLDERGQDVLVEDMGPSDPGAPAADRRVFRR